MKKLVLKDRKGYLDFVSSTYPDQPEQLTWATMLADRADSKSLHFRGVHLCGDFVTDLRVIVDKERFNLSIPEEEKQFWEIV